MQTNSNSYLNTFGKSVKQGLKEASQEEEQDWFESENSLTTNAGDTMMHGCIGGMPQSTLSTGDIFKD